MWQIHLPCTYTSAEVAKMRVDAIVVAFLVHILAFEALSVQSSPTRHISVSSFEKMILEATRSKYLSDCPPGETSCGFNCCSVGVSCCGGDCCSGSCCGGTCCTGTCCSSFQCCLPGQNCCGSSCCSNQCCGSTCCEPVESCCGVECCKDTLGNDDKRPVTKLGPLGHLLKIKQQQKLGM